jgi:hypothetical protein
MTEQHIKRWTKELQDANAINNDKPTLVAVYGDDKSRYFDEKSVKYLFDEVGCIEKFSRFVKLFCMLAKRRPVAYLYITTVK